MPHPSNTQPLTDEQSALAADPASITLAKQIANSFARRCPADPDAISSAAFYGLVLAARNFSLDAEVKFTTFAKYHIVGTIQDALRELLPKGFRRGVCSDAPKVDSLSRILFNRDKPIGELSDTVPAGELPVGWELESEDEVKGLCRKLPKAYGEAVALYYTRCEFAGRMRAISAELGTSESRVSQRISLAHAILRECGQSGVVTEVTEPTDTSDTDAQTSKIDH